LPQGQAVAMPKQTPTETNSEQQKPIPVIVYILSTINWFVCDDTQTTFCPM